MIIWSKSGNTVIYIIESNPINLIYLHVIICLKSLLSLEASISRSLKKACRIYKRRKSWNHQPNIQFCIHPPQLHLPFQPNLPQHFTAGLPNPNCLIVAQVLKPYNEIITPSDHGNNQIHQTWKTEAAQELWTLNIFRRHRTLWLLSPLCISEVLDFGLFHGALRSIYGSKLDPFMNCVEGVLWPHDFWTIRGHKLDIFWPLGSIRRTLWRHSWPGPARFVQGLWWWVFGRYVILRDRISQNIPEYLPYGFHMIP